MTGGCWIIWSLPAEIHTQASTMPAPKGKIWKWKFKFEFIGKCVDNISEIIAIYFLQQLTNVLNRLKYKDEKTSHA